MRVGVFLETVYAVVEVLFLRFAFRRLHAAPFRSSRHASHLRVLKVQPASARVKKRAMTQGASGDQLNDGAAALAETRLAPAIENAVNQVISNRLALGNQRVTLLAFPLAGCAAFHLFEYNCHMLSLDAVVHSSFIRSALIQ